MSIPEDREMWGEGEKTRGGMGEDAQDAQMGEDALDAQMGEGVMGWEKG